MDSIINRSPRWISLQQQQVEKNDSVVEKVQVESNFHRNFRLSVLLNIIIIKINKRSIMHSSSEQNLIRSIQIVFNVSHPFSLKRSKLVY